MSDIDIRVRTVIAEETGRPLSSVVPAARFGDDLGISGDDVAYLIGEVESEFGRTFTGRDPAEARTVGDVIRLVEGQISSFARRRGRA